MRTSAVGLALVALSCAAACTYDFDEAFSKTGEIGGGGGAVASSSTGSGTASTGGGGAATSGTGGIPGGEQCTNGADDDDDGLVDCADPDCTQFSCVTEAPKGWSGPSAFFVGASMAACDGGGTPLAGGMDPMPGAASCSACVCDAPSGGTCAMAQTVIYDSGFCSAIEGILSPAQANQCDTFTVSDPSSSAKGQVPLVASNPTCNASGGVLDAQPSTFAANTLICADVPVGAGCNSGAVCAATPAAPFLAAPCIHQMGDVDCPPGPYAIKTLAYSGIDEGRSCSGCSCGSASGVTCTGTTTIYSSGSCSAAIVVVPNDASCVPFSSSAQVGYEYMPGTPQGGSCQPGGGQLQGAVTGTGPITVCCPN